MATHSHRGVTFEVWNNQQSWFWMVLDLRGNRGAIGAVPSEAEALREAGCSIDANAGGSNRGQQRQDVCVQEFRA